MAGRIVKVGEGAHEDTPINPILNIHPLLMEFLKLLPAPGAKLDIERVNTLKQAFSWIFDLVYPK
jgi:hypothetical protein